MRGNLPTREPEILARWQAEGLYERLLDAQRRRRALPAARRAAVRQRQRPPRHGAQQDHQGRDREAAAHGRPPRALRAGLGLPRHADRAPGAARPRTRRRASMSRLEIRRRCRAFAEKYYRIQREQFQRLGVLGDWQNPYLTMTPDVRGGHRAHVPPPGRARLHLSRPAPGALVRHLLDRAGRGRGRVQRPHLALDLRPLPVRRHAPTRRRRWRARRAMPMRCAPRRAAGRLSAVIWTTTPWTLPANLAVCFNPTLDYVAIDLGDEIRHRRRPARRCVPRRHRPGDQRRPPLRGRPRRARRTGRRSATRCSTRPSRAVFETHVTADAGTGCVHTAPGHGYEDFQVGQKYGLPTLTPVDAEGRFTADAGPYVGRQGVRDQSAHRRRSARRRPSGAHREGVALLSALLALQEPADLPRHRAVVPAHRPRRPARERRWRRSIASAGCRSGGATASAT